MKATIGKYILTLATVLVTVIGASASAVNAETDSTFTSRRPTLSLGLNAAALPLLTFSPKIELGLSRKWGFELPVTYSPANYFSSKIKFRQLTLQPGFRNYFHTRRNDDDCFVGAHFGLSWYNMAFNGIHAFRNRAKSPGWGFGISGGWKHRFTESRNWYIEAEVGLGWYHLHYDVVENRAHGRVLYSRRCGRWLIDRVALTIGYQFHTSPARTR